LVCSQVLHWYADSDVRATVSQRIFNKEIGSAHKVPLMRLVNIGQLKQLD